MLLPITLAPKVPILSQMIVDAQAVEIHRRSDLRVGFDIARTILKTLDQVPLIF